MSDSFVLTVDYQGKERNFAAELLVMGYTHKFRVTIAEGMDVYFERDEEGRYRAVIPPEARKDQVPEPDIALLQAIAQTIETILE
ncbi:hypothetical protein SAMN05421788_1011506 [Filimonas lacunae]|uniref:Uncharacterized protein n=1 Tax=Filimonas lacunae TaxID=477680 RepID=A0A173MRF9_9BACT|nr:hypothetical protein [Filimonas lacunae]BAV10077.1 hypothetical protein FLA_6132 [Filimonas lacunae]SIS83649.1 hypothetical protein SAMN05421788_1011506 [Filimonas lacunae]